MTTIKKKQIDIPLDDIFKLAKCYRLKELALFGSVLGDRFGPESDIDVLIEFLPEANVSLFDIVDIEDELRALFGRDVDVVEKTGLKNPFRRRAILSNYEVIYAA